MKISDEFTRISMLREILLDEHRENSLVQVGVRQLDDAAVINIGQDLVLVVTSDFVRGSGFYLFQLGHLNYFDVGYYLVIANLSDLASMGARPTALTTIIRYSNRMCDDDFTEIFRGMDSAVKKYGTEIAGGDIGGYSDDVFAATAFGLMKPSQVLLRSNVRADDILCVTGVVGLPITALLYFKEVKNKGFNFTPEEEEFILRSWRRPNAKVAEGTLLAESGLGHACQDISDGLKATVEQMSSLSGRTFTVYEKAIPIDDTTRKMAKFLQVPSAQIAMSASVDFELAFTISRSDEEKCKELFSEHGLKFHVIGHVNTNNKNILLNADGMEVVLPGIPWAQQTNDYLNEIIGRQQSDD